VRAEGPQKIQEAAHCSLRGGSPLCSIQTSAIWDATASTADALLLVSALAAQGCKVRTRWVNIFRFSCPIQNIAAQIVRTIERRRAREQEAAATNELLATEPEASWEAIAPHLDAALGELNEADRDALLLRYFEKKSAQEMAVILGIRVGQRISFRFILALGTRQYLTIRKGGNRLGRGGVFTQGTFA